MKAVELGRLVLALGLVVLTSVDNASAIIIDRFQGDQLISLSNAGESGASLKTNAGVLGGVRSIETQATADGGVTVDVKQVSGIDRLAHSENDGAAGTTLVTWDGDNTIGLNNKAGLGGIDGRGDPGLWHTTGRAPFEWLRGQSLSGILPRATQRAQR